jgi:uncharacterized protein YacL (UPF0231 family)
MDIKIYKDRNGYPRVAAPESLEILGWFLEQDIQRCKYSCDEIIEIIDSVQQGKISYWKGTGNAHTFCITSELVTIYNEFSENSSPCSMDTREFKNAIILWGEFIEM